MTMTNQNAADGFAAASAMMLLAGTAQAADGMDVASAKTIYSQRAKADYLAEAISHEKRRWPTAQLAIPMTR